MDNAKGVLDWINQGLNLGITLFDTADVYPVKGGTAGDAVKVFGAALQLQPSLRSKIQIQAKLDIASFNPPYLNTSASYIEQQVDWFLSNLHTTYLDIVLLHYSDALLDADAVASTLNGLKNSGKVHYFGVSNHYPHKVKLLQSRLDQYGIELVTNEVEISVWNPSHLNYKDGTVDDLYASYMRPIAWCALGGDPLGGLNRLFQRYGTRQTKILNALGKVGDELGGYEEDVVALAWLLRHPSGIIPLIGTTNNERMAQQVTAMEVYARMTESQWWSIGTEGGLCAFGDDQCDYDEYKG
jgi:predicted oxidoreductase